MLRRTEIVSSGLDWMEWWISRLCGDGFAERAACSEAGDGAAVVVKYLEDWRCGWVCALGVCR